MRPFFYKRRFIFIPLAVVAFLSLISFVVMNLWNYLLPEILHVGIINFWQAMGIFILCKILFGFGKGNRMGGGAPWMRHQMAERLKNMSPEEKEKFKERLKNGCGWDKWGKDSRHSFDSKWDNFTTETEKTAE
ncbi:MAG: hypothetical protein JWP44_1944 [Mucilaginibacter sp.]|nr:hypothetical protein [Mucilaginibacter sp.]